MRETPSGSARRGFLIRLISNPKAAHPHKGRSQRHNRHYVLPEPIADELCFCRRILRRRQQSTLTACWYWRPQVGMDGIRPCGSGSSQTHRRVCLTSTGGPSPTLSPENDFSVFWCSGRSGKPPNTVRMRAKRGPSVRRGRMNRTVTLKG